MLSPSLASIIDLRPVTENTLRTLGEFATRYAESITEAAPPAYKVDISRKTAASISRETLPTGHSLLDVCSALDIPLGYHLIVSPVDPAGVEYKWADRHAQTYRRIGLEAADEVGSRFRSLFGLEGWGMTVAMNDENAARRDTIHIHVVITPPMSVLEDAGLALRPLVAPRIVLREGKS